MDKREIESVIVVTRQGAGANNIVGVNGVTSIELNCRQVSNDLFVDVIVVKNGDLIVEEISMLTPYILTYKK